MAGIAAKEAGRCEAEESLKQKSRSSSTPGVRAHFPTLSSHTLVVTQPNSAFNRRRLNIHGTSRGGRAGGGSVDVTGLPATRSGAAAPRTAARRGPIGGGRPVLC
ncbi:hypothetical protein AAFF_G00310630 [Aldrovandia affinis]|uniref:Uncharacterized protein n=1 Tax=Aldrovandia affinis TaxID=143900 RepID=A0AAD7R892_9TELE|nr:hypothetical protein AAFF_G00310630 [Aldrovandia affinis]